MNKDQVSGKIDQAVGKVQQSVGESVGNEKLANKGVVNQAKGAAKETWGDAKDAANSAAAAAADTAAAQASANDARKAASDAQTEAAAAKTADDAANAAAAQALTDAQGADAAANAATISANTALQNATDAEKDAGVAHTNAISAHNDADALNQAAADAQKAADATASSAANAADDAKKAADAANAALAQAVKDEKDREAAAADAAAHTDPNNWYVSSPVGVLARQDWCNLAANLHAGGTNVQTVIAAAFAGTDADRRAVSNIGWYDHDTSKFTTATDADRAAFDTWSNAHSDQTMFAPLVSEMAPFSFGMPTDWSNIPNYSENQRTLRANEADSATHFQSLTGGSTPTQAEIDRAIAIGAASKDPADASPVTNVAMLIRNGQISGNLGDDVAQYLTHGGFVQTAPDPGSLEFRTEVEDLKARWAGCNATNPWDPHHALTGVVTAASAEWQNELDAQATQRNDITTASIAASADLHKAADAMDQAMTLAWVGQHFLDWQRYWSTRQADYTFYGLDPALKDKAAANLVDLQNQIKAQLDIANAASADAKIQADKVTADQAAAGDIAKNNGTPYGRGLSHAMQSAQVTKASAAASQASALATETALHATQASVSDAAALWSLADTQAHAIQAQFARVAAEDAANQAHNAALAAADQAKQAAGQAVRAHNDRATAEKAQQDATAQAAIAHQKAGVAADARAQADAARADAQSKHDQAAALNAQAQSQANDAASARASAEQSSGAAADKAKAAADAEAKASSDRDAAAAAADRADNAAANAAAKDAYASAEGGKADAADAQAAANQADSEAYAARQAAVGAQQSADQSTTAASGARADATRAASSAATATAAAAGSDAAAAKTRADALTANAAAADAINAAQQAAINVQNAQADADKAASQAASAKSDADTAQAEAIQAGADAATTAGHAQASAAAALAARDSASHIAEPANSAIQFGSPYQATDAAAGLSVLVAQDSKTLGQQQDAAAQAASAESDRAATAAQTLADQATGDAKAAAIAAAAAAADSNAAQKSLASARASAESAATDAAAAQAAANATTTSATQATNDAAAAKQNAVDATNDATAAAGIASDAEKDAAAAHTAASSAAADASAAQDAANSADASAAAAAKSATTAQADATAAQASASQADTAAHERMVAAASSSSGLSGVDGIVPEPSSNITVELVHGDICADWNGCDVTFTFSVTGDINYYEIACDAGVGSSLCPAGSPGYQKIFLGKNHLDHQQFSETHHVTGWEAAKAIAGFWADVVKSIVAGAINDFKGCASSVQSFSPDWAKCGSAALWAAPPFIKGGALAVDSLRTAIALQDFAKIADATDALSKAGLSADVIAGLKESTTVRVLADCAINGATGLRSNGLAVRAVYTMAATGFTTECPVANLTETGKETYQTLQAAVARARALTPAQVSSQVSMAMKNAAVDKPWLKRAYLGSILENNVAADSAVRDLIARGLLKHLGTSAPGTEVADFVIVDSSSADGVNIDVTTVGQVSTKAGKAYIDSRGQVLDYPSYDDAFVNAVFP